MGRRNWGYIAGFNANIPAFGLPFEELVIGEGTCGNGVDCPPGEVMLTSSSKMKVFPRRRVTITS